MTSAATITIRPMRLEDLPVVMEIEASCYTEIAPESHECLGAKLSSSPSTCFVVCKGAEIAAFLISHPIQFESPPQLHALLCPVPDHADTLYLHDLAVAPTYRGCGAGRLLMNTFISKIKELKFKRASLIAVQDSYDYWRRFGFNPVDVTGPLKDKLASYGRAARYMEWKI